jgi:hypothetical protein
VGIVGGTVTAAARELGHWITFGLTLFMMILITAYTWYKSKDRWGTYWDRYGPLYLVAASSFLIMADPTRHILQDLHVWKAGPEWNSSSMYRWHCHHETLVCLTFVGWMFELCTYIGFIMLITGSMWNANIVDKMRELREKWRELRNQSSSEPGSD